MDRARGGGRASGSRSGSTRLGRLASRLSTSPTRITAVYLAFGLGALVLSDGLLVWVLSDPLLSQLQALKAGFEVLLTAGLIYWLTAASRASHRETTAELERHREELRVLHRLLRHNLRNDLNVVRGEVERLRDAGGEDHERTCASVLRASEEIVDYTERARTIRKLTELESATVDLAELVPGIVAEHERVAVEADGTDDDSDADDDPRAVADTGVDDERGTNAELHATLPDSAPVQVNELFEVALAELVTNAVVHGGASPRVEVTVEPESGRAGMTLVEVSDDGPGLPDYAADVLRGEERDQLVHLDGLGLWLAYLTVIESGGEFEIPPDTDGATIRMYLPTARSESDGLLPNLPGTLQLPPGAP